MTLGGGSKSQRSTIERHNSISPVTMVTVDCTHAHGDDRHLHIRSRSEHAQPEATCKSDWEGEPYCSNLVFPCGPMPSYRSIMGGCKRGKKMHDPLTAAVGETRANSV